MGTRDRLMRVYFDRVYNSVYDFTTARLTRYRKLQERCISKLELRNNDRVLCAGVGTGNEIIHLLSMNNSVQIVGVDYSGKALQRARQKILKRGKEIETHVMDVQRLDFPTESFDKVLCIHVMDFLDQDMQATSEIFRVLKDGGQFVITFPSDREGTKLGGNLARETLYHHSGKRRVRAFFELIGIASVGIVYLPILARPKTKCRSSHDLTEMMGEIGIKDFQVEEEPIYLDYIVHGRKMG